MFRLSRARPASSWVVFAAVLLLALTWAFTTKHVWEDYYITYRSSKNLATGNGLVFTPGERLHTFTSPLGVLLPAAASWLTRNRSDIAAIWIFRVWSAAALAGGVVLLLQVARRRGYGLFAGIVLVAGVALDAKSLDFATNGMETGLLVLFLAWTLRELVAPAEHERYVPLGLAWAGLMWTRPDCCLYIALLGVGRLVFNDRESTGLTRAEQLSRLIKAAVVCAIAYLPWFAWSAWYYGSPVPHTIVAKGNVAGGPKTLIGAVGTLLVMPWSAWTGATSLEATFLPSYFQIGGWPIAAVVAARIVGVLLAFQWLWPRWRSEVRIASFAFCGLHVYLTYFPFFPFPWYLPGPNVFAVLTAAGIAAQLTEHAKTGTVRRVTMAVCSVALAGEAWLTWQMAREMKVEQRLSADAVRTQTGLWLKAHAKPGDTVFMEPLGHIAYFSGLKTYDFPGLSSREVVRATKVVGVDWARLIEYLSPDWIVLRPSEIERVRRSIPRVMNETYVYATQFDTTDAVSREPIYGRGYVAHDARWVVFRRTLPKRYRVDLDDPAVRARYPLKREFFQDGVDCFQLHANGLISFQVPLAAKHLRIRYGLPRGTYEATPKTDGATFIVWLFDGKSARQLTLRTLDPVNVPADRVLQTFEAGLPPAGGHEREILLETVSGPTDAMDWCCWTKPQFSP